MSVNYFIMYILVKSFAGFNVSGHPIFYMVPFAFSTYICFAMVLIGSSLFLWKKDMQYDLFLVSSAQTGVLVGAITILLGMIWSYVEWGYFWQWEPRQTATLIMWLAYIGLLIFREIQDDRDHNKRATLTAIFGIATFPSVPLSNFVVGALHPPPQQTLLGPGVGIYLMLNFLFIGIITIKLISVTYRGKKLDFRIGEIRKRKMDEL